MVKLLTVSFLSISLACSSLAFAECDKKKAKQEIDTSIESGLFKRTKAKDGTLIYDMRFPWYSMNEKEQIGFANDVYGEEECVAGKPVKMRIVYKGKDVAQSNGKDPIAVIKDDPTDAIAPLPKFSVKQQHTIPGIKISFDCFLEKPVSHTMLARLYEKMRQDYNTDAYENVFIMWYLPHYKVGGGAWGVTNCQNGKTNIRIIAMQD